MNDTHFFRLLNKEGLIGMNHICLGSILAFFIFFTSCTSKKQLELTDKVEVLRDKHGINHIYANNQEDLFFMQGYLAAKDRLFQFEIWRRQATGTVAEIFGESELKRDIGTRLFKFRGNIKDELNHYHEDGYEIISSYTQGVNAYIEEVKNQPEKLPIEFTLLDIQPEFWTPADVISRHQGLLGNIDQELNIGRAVSKIGEDKVKELLWLHPKEPSLKLHKKIRKEDLDQDILGLYNAYRTPIKFKKEYLLEKFQKKEALAIAFSEKIEDLEDEFSIGSNNWAISGKKSFNGSPILANDPHRSIVAPSLRYITHLVAPGWNVIGGGEPEIPGISIGHNGFGAWGLTVFRTDAEDLYVYEINPKNSNQYWHKGEWLDFKEIKETILVKGKENHEIVLRYSIHGPVTFVDEKRNRAYAVKCGWLEVGGSPYLASLRMNQSQSWEEFREACNYSHIPGENMVWADKNGTIGWQAVGIAPIRNTHSGLVPVLGDGNYEWDGYLEIKQKPNSFNPGVGYIETSNSNYTPPDYPHLDAIAHTWTDPYRWARGSELLSSGRKFNMTDMIEFQHDYLSIPARSLVPFFKDLSADDRQVEAARQMLLNWDFQLDKDSVEAGIYVAFERQLLDNIELLKVPEEASSFLNVGMKTTIDMLLAPDGDFGSDPIAGRDEFVLDTLGQAVATLREKFGRNMDDWVYGQAEYKHALLRHPLGAAVSEEIRERLEVGPAPRGGNGFTVGATGSGDNQTSGASFRIFIDTRDWDNTLGMNTPGQVGDPDSPLYDNLFELWANDKVFPAFYSRDKIESVLYEKLDLIPVN